MLQQILQGQANAAMETTKKLGELNHKMDSSFNAIYAKIEVLNSRVTALENKSASTSSSAPTTNGQLPGKAVQNPKEYAHVNAIFLGNTHDFSSRTYPTQITADSEIQVWGDLSSYEAGNADSAKTSLDSSTWTKPESAIKGKPTLDDELPASKEKETPYVPPPYIPKLPFPSRFKKEIMAKYPEIFDKHTKEGKAQGVLVPNDECNAITVEKQGDPGSFTLPCSLGPLTFNKCLCDLGASINLMPLSVAKKMGFNDFKASNVTLLLADRSIRYPIGILENLPIKIKDVEIPTDFVVLEMDKEPRDPLIFGRPFLATVGAEINVKKGNIRLNVGKGPRMIFNIKSKTKKLTIQGQLFSIKERNEIDDEDGYSSSDSVEDESGKDPTQSSTHHGAFKLIKEPDAGIPSEADETEKLGVATNQRKLPISEGGNSELEHQLVHIQPQKPTLGIISSENSFDLQTPTADLKSGDQVLLINPNLKHFSRDVNPICSRKFIIKEILPDGAIILAVEPDEKSELNNELNPNDDGWISPGGKPGKRTSVLLGEPSQGH